MPDKGIISRVIDWLSVGYPKDVPVQDRAAVMAILKMRLTDEQLQEVVRQLMQSRAARGEAYVSDQRINEYIRRVVDHTPTRRPVRFVLRSWPPSRQTLHHRRSLSRMTKNSRVG